MEDIKKKEQQFHKERIAFLIINDSVLFLENSGMSHKEWFESLKIDTVDFEQVVRGYVKDNNIVFYKGDFIYDDEVIKKAYEFYKHIMEKTHLHNADVYCGVQKGKVGEVWKFIKKLDI